MRVYYINFDHEPELYDKTVHLNEIVKFLYWENGGDDILIAGSRRADTHRRLRDMAGSLAPNCNPDGAGQVEWRPTTPQIKYWDSTGFDIVTPRELRPKIAEALGIEDAM